MRPMLDVDFLRADFPSDTIYFLVFVNADGSKPPAYVVTALCQWFLLMLRPGGATIRSMWAWSNLPVLEYMQLSSRGFVR